MMGVVGHPATVTPPTPHLRAWDSFQVLRCRGRAVVDDHFERLILGLQRNHDQTVLSLTLQQRQQLCPLHLKGLVYALGQVLDNACMLVPIQLDKECRSETIMTNDLSTSLAPTNVWHSAQSAQHRTSNHSNSYCEFVERRSHRFEGVLPPCAWQSARADDRCSTPEIIRENNPQWPHRWPETRLKTRFLIGTKAC